MSEEYFVVKKTNSKGITIKCGNFDTEIDLNSVKAVNEFIGSVMAEALEVFGDEV